LATLRTVVEEGSYSKAASALSISQPAVSKQIRRLERSFGAKLFWVAGQQLQLTNAGRRAYELACRFLDEFSMQQAINERAGNPRDSVTIACNANALMDQLRAVLPQFAVIYPGIEVRTIHKARFQINEAVKSGVADVGIQTNPYLDETLVSVPNRHDSFIFVAGADNQRAGPYRTSAEQMSKQRVLISSGVHGKLVRQWFAVHGAELEHLTVLSCFEEVRALAKENLGVGILPGSIVEEDLATKRLVQLLVDDFALSRNTYVIYRHDIQPPSRWLADFLVNRSFN
jgi:DNA-binding transcriptional LysR family regulator